MRILVLANSAGGLSNFRSELLTTLVGEGFEVFFAVPQLHDHGAVMSLLNLGCHHIHVPMNRRGINPLEDVRLIRRYRRSIQWVAPDLILTYTIKPNIYGSYIANRVGIPVIMNITGIGSSLSSGKLKFLIKRMYRYACRRASTVFFQNQENMNFFLENAMVDNNKARLIPGSGVNLEKFQPMEKTVQDDAIMRFLYIGRIMKEKGIGEYLEAAEKIVKQYPKTEFQILGSYEEERYRDLIERNQNIRFLGRSSDVREQIREVDCIVHPSYHEGMSNVLLEGAAMGKPLLASNIPGCREIVDHGVNGYLFEPKSPDSLIEAIQVFLEQDSDTLVKMGIESRRKVEREFDRKLVVKAYLQAIDEIMDRK